MTAKLERQRERRKVKRRIDYYPSPEALALIDRFAEDRSTVINAMVCHAAPSWIASLEALPEGSTGPSP